MISIGVFKICDERVFLADLDVVVSELILVMLVLSTFNLILVRIFRILVEVRLTLAVQSKLEHLLSVTVCTTSNYSILDRFK